MIHGGDIYGRKVRYDFSVSVNPSQRPEAVRDAMVAAAERVEAYPDIMQREFREKLAQFERLEPDEIWGGNGASELLMGIAYWLRPKRAALLAPCFYGYRHVLSALGDCQIVEFPLDVTHGFLLSEEFLDWLAVVDVDALFIANPNNPTGRLVAPGLMAQILARCRAAGAAVVLDESFLRTSSGGRSERRRLAEFPNLYVVDAFTKLFAIPGARAGYVVSAAENIAGVRSRLPEWNMSSFATSAALACLETMATTDFVAESVHTIERERRYLTDALRSMGLRVFDSDTNFLLFYSETPLARALLTKGILIRDCRNFAGLTAGFYRIAVRARAENEILVAAIAELLGEVR